MPDSTTPIQQCLDRLRLGDASARQDLLRHAYARLERLTRRQRRRFAGVEETGDILNDVVLRLDRALEKVPLEDVAGFLAVASQHIRWALLNAAERRPGAAESGERADSAPGPA